MKYATFAIHGGVRAQQDVKGVNVPIELSTTFAQPSLSQPQKFEYARGNNPTRAYVESLMAELEHAKYGVAVSSGMAATTLAFGILEQGDTVLLNSNVYGGTYRYVSNLFKRHGIAYHMVRDFNSLRKEDLKDVRALFIETPSNPLLEVYDIAHLAELAHQTDTLLIVDNTFMTSYFQRPLELGADVVVYSATKYYGGHSDVIAGFVLTNNDALNEQFRFLQNTYGGILSPFDSYLIARGIKTMPLRLEASQNNALALAKMLEKSDAVDAIHYPGLASHPQHELQTKQASGYGAVFSILLSEKYDLDSFLDHLQIFDLAVSLGGVESLVCRPATMTHESYDPALQKEIGIDQRLIRFAVGVEDIEDLKADITQALEESRK
ncbi:MAG: trans-sulfuration enzyme family protein [Catenisphaera adipataccumulans]|jgi:cystathionine beta-lyase|uniref:trans-sulfuration enzyme family protein n=1 Tax=Catenisphaera adipataccumulans TaxID=700500 RepID=UPI003D89C61E